MNNLQTMGTQHLFLFACWCNAPSKTQQNRKKKVDTASVPTGLFLSNEISGMCIFHACSLFGVSLSLFFFHMSWKCHLLNWKCQTARGRYPRVVCVLLPDCESKTEIYEVMRLANRGAGQTSRRRWLQKQFVADGHGSDGAGLAVCTAVSGLDCGSAGGASSVTTPGHSSMPLLKTNLHKQKSEPWFLQTFALVGGLSSVPRPRVNTASVSAGYK